MFENHSISARFFFSFFCGWRFSARSSGAAEWAGLNVGRGVLGGPCVSVTGLSPACGGGPGDSPGESASRLN